MDIEIGVEHLRSEHINLTLSNIKRGTDLGMLVVPFDQTFHPLHLWWRFIVVLDLLCVDLDVKVENVQL